MRVEKNTFLGDGTVVVSRLEPPAMFGEYFFLMGKPTASLTSFISDQDGALESSCTSEGVREREKVVIARYGTIL